ncbi:hypothetical protein D6C98_04866 [Aureobasidium pullulans]|nr:hypothetical protein D6C98_04866 [Aureobasidium pullulans]
MSDQDQIDQFNQQIQHNLLLELTQYAWLDAWLPEPRPELQNAEDIALQQEMIQSCRTYPYVLHLTSRITGDRVWWVAFHDAEDLVQHVIRFAGTTTVDFALHCARAYTYWIRGGRADKWNPESFLRMVSTQTYFMWSSTPNFNTHDINAWTPAADEYTNLRLQEVLYPSTELAASNHPEFLVSHQLATQFAALNRDDIVRLPQVFEVDNFLREIRKGRFLTLGLPLITKTQACAEGLIPTLYRSGHGYVPDYMVMWAQDVDLLARFAISQGRQDQAPADTLAASMALRRLCPGVLVDYLSPQTPPSSPPPTSPRPAAAQLTTPQFAAPQPTTPQPPAQDAHPGDANTEAETDIQTGYDRMITDVNTFSTEMTDQQRADLQAQNDNFLAMLNNRFA